MVMPMIDSFQLAASLLRRPTEGRKMEKNSLMAKIRRFIHSGERFRVVLLWGEDEEVRKMREMPRVRLLYHSTFDDGVSMICYHCPVKSYATLIGCFQSSTQQ
jgi:hypothetical protein